VGALMPAFDTPQPINAVLDIPMGDVRVRASERADTVVEVTPTDAENRDDVKAASQTRVELSHGELLVKTPRLRTFSIRGSGGSVDVVVELPADSGLNATVGLGNLDADGPLGDTRLKTGLGTIRLGSATTLRVRAGAGDIDVGSASGHADISTGSGEVRVRELQASGVVKNSNGDTWIGTATGDLRLQAANGRLAVDAAHASVVAKSSNGDIRLGEARGREVVLETKIGDVEVGVPEGVTAWLDVSATAGHVDSALETTTQPDDGARTVDVRARTSLGDILIRRPA
jgi:DUF4097 and DUF4098 domain-containing protein YvlB